MADAQIAIIDGDQTQVVLAPGENPAIVTSIPGPQGPAGAGVPTGGAANEVLYKVSSTFGDTAWGPITSAMIGDLQIVNADVSASAAIAGTKISPNFGSQNVTTTGTNTAASFIPTSSTAPTNGLYLPSANSVALSTNGTGRLFIDANGNFGLTAASPAWGDSVNGSRAIQIGGSSWYQYRTSIINFGHGYYYDAADTYRYLYTGTPVSYYQQTAGEHRWFNAASGTAGNTFTPTERLRITSTGQLSHIGAGSSGSPAVSFSGSAASNSLVVDSSSRVGIGTSSPSKRFTILQDGADSALRIEQSGEGYNFYRNQANGFLYLEGPQQTFSGFGFRVTPTGGSTTNAVWIDNSGRVGIGTTSPGANLHVQSLGDATQYLAGGTTTSTSRLFFINNTANSSIGCTAAGNELAFYTGPTERARITSSGQLLVGTATSTGQGVRLQVEGTDFGGSGAQIRRNSADGSAPSLAFQKSRGTTNASVTSVQDADRLMQILAFGADGTTNLQAAEIAAFVDGTPGANTMPGRLVFSTTSSTPGAFPTPRLTITSTGQVRLAGAGITFNGDTATANELDDYEEGTWTPAANVGTLTSNATATYTKIGRTVTVFFDVTMPTQTDGNSARLDGLPFNPGSAGAGVALGYTTYGAAVTMGTGFLAGSSFSFRDISGNLLTLTNVSGKRFAGACTYSV